MRKAVSGLHDIDSCDISLRVLSLLRLAARFEIEALNIKKIEHEICFDFNLSDIKEFETVSMSKVGQHTSDALYKKASSAQKGVLMQLT